MQNLGCWKALRARQIVLAAAVLANGALFLDAAPGYALDGDSEGLQPPPNERQAETGAKSRRVDRAEDLIALLHEGNRVELEGARVALARGQAERVKSYARLLTREHQRCDKQLMDYADQNRLDRRSLEDRTRPSADSPLERLRVRRPQDFDRAFILAMVREHGRMIDALTSMLHESRDNDLRPLLARQLSVLESLKKAGEAILARLPASRGSTKVRSTSYAHNEGRSE